MENSERIARLENTMEKLRENTITSLAKIGLNPKTLQPDNGLFERISKAEQEIQAIKKSLEGNVTWKGLYAALLTAGTVMTTLLFLAGLFMKLLNK